MPVSNKSSQSGNEGPTRGKGKTCSFACRICGNKNSNLQYNAREMMYGFRDEFEYIECHECGCLQISGIPANLEKYYPKSYWQFQKDRHEFGKDGLLTRIIRYQRAKYWLFYRRNIMGKLFSVGRLQPRYFGWLRRGCVDFDSAILDVGCGLGDRILELAKDGFNNLTGVDPFIDNDLFYDNGVKVYKRHLHDMDGQYDFIMLHHSFEHMPDPVSVIEDLFRLLKHKRILLIRIPVASSYAWHHYGVDWVQLDAPRHLFLHSIESMKLLAEHAGFVIREVLFDSLPFQFTGSEQYQKDIPLYDERSYDLHPDNGLFSEAEIEEFRRRTRELNARREGDQACFYLYKA